MQLGVTRPLLRLVAKPTKPEILRTWLTFFHFKCLCTDYFINAQVMKGAHYSNSYYLVLTLERISWEVQIWIKNTNLSFLEVIFQILMFEERSITVLIIWFVKLMGPQGLCLGGEEILIWIYVMWGTPFCGASTRSSIGMTNWWRMDNSRDNRTENWLRAEEWGNKMESRLVFWVPKYLEAISFEWNQNIFRLKHFYTLLRNDIADNFR